MIIWLASYPRSGVTFVRTALHCLFGLPSGTVYSIADEPETVPPIIRELPRDMTVQEMAVTPGPCFLKTHEMPGHDNSPAMYLVRDGRDVLVSYAHYILDTEHSIAPGGDRALFLQVLEQLITSREHFGGWCNHVLAWMRRIPAASIVSFEDLIFNPGEVLEDALAGVGVGGRLAKHRNALPSFDELHKAAPWFFRKGKVGSWREEMPPRLQQLFWQHHREAMEAIGYVASGSERSIETVKDTNSATAAHQQVSGTDIAYFFSPNYERYTRSLLVHLETLGLPLSGIRVLEVGSGPGVHTGFYVYRQCEIVSVDSRTTCLNILKERFPEVQTVACDLNAPAALSNLGTFDVIHCYGILYNVEKPAELISYIGAACTGVAIVETCVSLGPGEDGVRERSEDHTQPSTGRGSRLTRERVFELLGRAFPYVYQTKTQPANPEFPTNWNDLRAPALVRAVFVASKQPLDLPTLSPALLDSQEQLPAHVRDLHVAAGACRTWLSIAATAWEEAARKEKDLQRVLATTQEHEQRALRLEHVAAERLAAMEDRDRLISRLHAEIESRNQAIRDLKNRAEALEATAADRLTAMTDRDREIQIREERIAALETVAAERLAAMQDRDRVILDMSRRADSLEAAATERLAAVHERDQLIGRLLAEKESVKTIEPQ